MEGIASSVVANRYFIVVPDEKVYLSSGELDGSKIDLSYYYAFDTDSSAEMEIKLTNEIDNGIKKLSIDGHSEVFELN